MECQFYTHVFQDGNNHITLILNDYGPWLPVPGCASATGLLWTRGYDYRIHTLLHSSKYRWTKKKSGFLLRNSHSPSWPHVERPNHNMDEIITVRLQLAPWGLIILKSQRTPWFCLSRKVLRLYLCLKNLELKKKSYIALHVLKWVNTFFQGASYFWHHFEHYTRI